MIRAKLDLKNLEMSFGDREFEFGLGFRDLSDEFVDVMLRLKRLPKNKRKIFFKQFTLVDHVIKSLDVLKTFIDSILKYIIAS